MKKLKNALLMFVNLVLSSFVMTLLWTMYGHIPFMSVIWSLVMILVVATLWVCPVIACVISSCIVYRDSFWRLLRRYFRSLLGAMGLLWIATLVGISMFARSDNYDKLLLMLFMLIFGSVIGLTFPLIVYERMRLGASLVRAIKLCCTKFIYILLGTLFVALLFYLSGKLIALIPGSALFNQANAVLFIPLMSMVYYYLMENKLKL